MNQPDPPDTAGSPGQDRITSSAALCPSRSPESAVPCTLPDYAGPHDMGHESYTGQGRWVSWSTTPDDHERWAMTTRVVLTIEIDGDSLKDAVNRLYDLAVRLDEAGRTLPVQMVGGRHIVTVREADKAPKVDWREAQG